MPRQIVISASRRTDIPAFYMPWFMDRLDKGHFEVTNPYNRQISRVAAGSDQVHTIVFWSKNFAEFINQDYGRRIEQRGYHLFFNFTINSPHPLLEPGVPPLEERLDQLARLSDRHGPESIQWRFDPICYIKDIAVGDLSNLDQFETIAEQAAKMGIRVCITSFVDLYRKVQARLKKKAAPALFDPPMNTKIAQIKAMEKLLAGLEMQLHLCCEKDVLANLPEQTSVIAAACVPTHRIAALYGPGIALGKDKGQRTVSGCQCGQSKDIGSYGDHPCYHNCLFCYANPQK